MKKVPLLMFVSILCCSAAIGTTMPSVRMRVIDSADGQPVSGAIAMFRTEVTEGTLTGHGGKHKNLFLAEAISDLNGSISFPEQHFNPHPFLLNTNYDFPVMVIFMLGYKTEVLSNSNGTFANKEDITHWNYNDRVIKLKRLQEDEKLNESVQWAQEYTVWAYNGNGEIDYKACAWEKIPHLIVSVDRALKVREHDSKLLDSKNILRFTQSPLEFLLSNDELITKRGCSSTKIFFQNYLK